MENNTLQMFQPAVQKIRCEYIGVTPSDEFVRSKPVDHTPYEYWLELELAILRDAFSKLSSARDEDLRRMLELADALNKTTKGKAGGPQEPEKASGG